MPVQSIYIDVDLTLIDPNGKIYPHVEQTLIRWRRMYKTVVCWSHTGGEYAKQMCVDNKIDKYFDFFLDKPDLIVDDAPERLMDYAHVLLVDDATTWWSQAFNTLYQKHVKLRGKIK